MDQGSWDVFTDAQQAYLTDPVLHARVVNAVNAAVAAELVQPYAEDGSDTPEIIALRTGALLALYMRGQEPLTGLGGS